MNSGATPDELARGLDMSGFANEPIAVMSGDMTGDGMNEVVVSIFDQSSKGIPPACRLLILLCEGDQFSLKFDQPTPEVIGGPLLWVLQDLNADGSEELVDSLARCGWLICIPQTLHSMKSSKWLKNSGEQQSGNSGPGL